MHIFTCQLGNHEISGVTTGSKQRNLGTRAERDTSLKGSILKNSIMVLKS